ncbi:MAG: cytochrome c oxidase assembly protein, partial [Pseudomonadota bacterium]|nr:cytochrome c oxidase assembly protein [Pseudomonadota bacterium]
MTPWWMLPGALLWGSASAHTALAVEIPYGWNFDPFVAVPLTAAALAYAAGLGRLWRRAGRGRGVTVRRAAAFALGFGVLAAALLSPLEALAEASFAAHMA